MKAFVRALGVDLRRSILSAPFVWTAGLLLAWLLLNSSAELAAISMRDIASVPQVLNSALSNINGFTYLLPALAPMCYGWSHCLDTRCGFRMAAMERVGVRAYALSRALSTALSAFLVVAVSTGIYLVFLHFLGFADPNPEILQNGYGYLNLVAEGHLGFFYFVRIVLLGLACSLFSVFSLLVSAYIPNVYLSILSPAIAYYTWYVICVALRLGGLLQLDVVIFGQAFSDDLRSFAWAAEMLLVLTVLCTYLFFCRLRKEQEA